MPFLVDIRNSYCQRPITRLSFPNEPQQVRNINSSRNCYARRKPRYMPSFKHELLLALLKQQPKVIEKWLRQALKLKGPLSFQVEAIDTTLSQLKPAQFLPDILLRIRLNRPGEPERLVILEIQLRSDPAKRSAWLGYVLFTQRQYGKFPTLIVVAPDEHTASWARLPYSIGLLGEVCPFVIGPEQIPKQLSLNLERRHPEFGLLTLVAHGQILGETGQAIAEAALEGLKHSEASPDLKTAYFDFILKHLPKKLAEAIMYKFGDYELESPLLIAALEKARNQGELEGLREGELKGLREGELKGLREGELKGLREGELKGKLEEQRRTLMRLIERKFDVQLSTEQLTRIQNAASAQLDQLTERILDANSIEELFQNN